MTHPEKQKLAILVEQIVKSAGWLGQAEALTDDAQVVLHMSYAAAHMNVVADRIIELCKQGG